MYLLNLLFQVRNLLSQVQGLNGSNRVLQDGHGRPNLRPGFATNQIPPQGLHGLSGGTLQPAQGGFDNLAAGVAVELRELRQAEPALEGAVADLGLARGLLDRRFRQEGSNR
jgi:hypothetical protein